jgi:DNA processing protein
MSSEQHYSSDWPFRIALTRVVGIGPARFERLLRYFGSAEGAWRATPAGLVAAGLDAPAVRALVALRANHVPALEAENLAALGIWAVLREEPNYPEALRTLPDPPPVLFGRGTLTIGDQWAVALVGTRRATPYGRQAAEHLATALAQAGVTVVSGLARGIDGYAHRAALAAGGRTLAVLGHGLDTVYPPEHRRLAAEIAENGALLTEFPPGTRPDAANFPRRNRILAGLCRATVVVEAGRPSGALITADLALEQGRDVFAVPGSIFSPASRGTNWLLKEGARPVTDPNDLLEELHLSMAVEKQSMRQAVPSDPKEQAVLAGLGSDPVHVDELSRAVGLPVSDVSGTLVLMELKGLARQVSALCYVRAHP